MRASEQTCRHADLLIAILRTPPPREGRSNKLLLLLLRHTFYFHAISRELPQTHSAVFTCVFTPAERGPSLESIYGVSLTADLCDAKVEAENQQHLLHRYLQLSQRSTSTANVQQYAS